MNGLGKNGADYSTRYCWVLRVRHETVREVVGYYDQQKVAELFS